ncbi:hypothetical protein K474DRAFT_1657522 [Panus rudis PR-1116 ss-1]|nr:hypothetical protein K474DRAFT_1668269 [Panus rudis PR-1116 ss-1]KAI0072617.1 hypothetical protein K474DRAFT_1667605 [Panus rudis PR-1116 ss-1]KAI0072624.1 hypothetical protein K474DRAFT_1667616 [Panus rudis PR-1116 ss-1]KAI0072750.1 hypothetical protein K474DRAFT_1667429 [Panus rudis PR-1116 ss-1]KAI0072988.1 hypothetical protein K474DRAFT_1667148 [Panus rudis PR-1116 ss-1]
MILNLKQYYDIIAFHSFSGPAQFKFPRFRTAFQPLCGAFQPSRRAISLGFSQDLMNLRID